MNSTRHLEKSHLRDFMTDILEGKRKKGQIQTLKMTTGHECERRANWEESGVTGMGAGQEGDRETYD